LAPPGGIEPHAVHPTLRIGLEDRCRARGDLLMLVSDLFELGLLAYFFKCLFAHQKSSRIIKLMHKIIFNTINIFGVFLYIITDNFITVESVTKYN